MLTEKEQQILIDGWRSYEAMDRHLTQMDDPFIARDVCRGCSKYLLALLRGQDARSPEVMALRCENTQRWMADMDAAAALAKAKGRP